MNRKTILICAGLAVMFLAGRVSAPRAESAQPDAPGVVAEADVAAEPEGAADEMKTSAESDEETAASGNGFPAGEAGADVAAEPEGAADEMKTSAESDEETAASGNGSPAGEAGADVAAEPEGAADEMKTSAESDEETAAASGNGFPAGENGVDGSQSGAAGPRVIDDPAAIENLAATSVVRLEIYNSDEKMIATGSGFAAFGSDVLVTSCHVIVNMDYCIAIRDDGSSFRMDHCFFADEDRDLALMELPEDAGLVPLSYREDYPRRGERVFAIGSQFGCINLVSLGNVSGIWERGDQAWLLFTAPVSGGNSGCPLLDGDGRVVGIVSGAYEKGQNLNLAVPIGDVIPEEVKSGKQGLEGTETDEA